MFFSGNSRFFNRVLLLIFTGLFLYTCERLELVKLVKIVTRSPVSISYHEAVLSGAVVDFGEEQIIQHGHCWATHDHPSMFDATSLHSSLEFMDKPRQFSSVISGLQPGTTYYYCAYCYDGQEAFYGEVMTFNTLAITATTITTSDVIDISVGSAVSGGNVIDDGGLQIISRGVCWSTMQNPTATDSITMDGGGEGQFVSNLTGLNSNTIYYARAYATNETNITTYGEERSFRTYHSVVSDVDGNSYFGVKIGEQVWMAKNLGVTHYNNGDAIPNIESGASWTNATTGAFCNFNNDEELYSTYGRLYNLNAVRDSRRLCPAGWHMPADVEWTQLVNFLGGETKAGGKMKETGSTHWGDPNTGATNESNFTALAAGRRHYQGSFERLFENAYWWGDSEVPCSRVLYNNNATIFRYDCDTHDGNSVRCIKD
jgi:uncharacterized protein (TIGR02145 family)